MSLIKSPMRRKELYGIYSHPYRIFVDKTRREGPFRGRKDSCLLTVLAVGLHRHFYFYLRCVYGLYSASVKVLSLINEKLCEPGSFIRLLVFLKTSPKPAVRAPFSSLYSNCHPGGMRAPPPFLGWSPQLSFLGQWLISD